MPREGSTGPQGGLEPADKMTLSVAADRVAENS